jgi:predicted porin
MKKIIKILLPVLAFAQTTIALEEKGITVKPKGSFDFSFGAVHDNGPHDKKSITANRDGIGFFSSAGVSINVENKLEEDLAYGAKIALQTSTMSDRKTPTMAYFESCVGKFEVGSDKSATTKMKITALSQSSGSNGVWDMWAIPDIRDKKIKYQTNSGGFVDTKSRMYKDLEFARKITYFTPEMSGFQAGISYIPDTANAGHNTLKDPVHNVTGISHGYSFGIKDAIAWGVTQKFKVGDDLSFKGSVTGECGKVVARNSETKELVKNIKFKNLKTYTIGGEVKYSQFALAGSYSDFMKSMTSSAIDDAGYTKSTVKTIGGKYSFDQLSFSLTLLASDHKKNKVNAVTFATDYKLAPGLLPYAEVTAYNAKGWYKDAKGERFSDTHRGTLLLVGMRMEF